MCCWYNILHCKIIWAYIQEINYDIAIMKMDMDFIKRKLSTVKLVATKSQIDIAKEWLEKTSNSLQDQMRKSSTSAQQPKVAAPVAAAVNQPVVMIDEVAEASEREGLIPPDRLSQLFIKSCSKHGC